MGGAAASYLTEVLATLKRFRYGPCKEPRRHAGMMTKHFEMWLKQDLEAEPPWGIAALGASSLPGLPPRIFKERL